MHLTQTEDACVDLVLQTSLSVRKDLYADSSLSVSLTACSLIVVIPFSLYSKNVCIMLQNSLRSLEHCVIHVAISQ